MTFEISAAIVFVGVIFDIIGFFPFLRLVKLEKDVEKICYSRVDKEVQKFKETKVEKFVDKVNKETEPLSNLIQAKTYFYYLIISGLILMASVLAYSALPELSLIYFVIYISSIYTVYLAVYIVYRTIKIENFVRKNKNGE